MNYKLQFTLSAFLLFCLSALLPSALFAQKLFSISQNHLSQENVTHLRDQVAQSDILELSLTRNNEDKSVYAVPLSSIQNTKIVIFNEETGGNVMIIPVDESCIEFQVTPFFIEEMRQAILGDAGHYLMIEAWEETSQPEVFTVKNIFSVPVSNDEVYIPKYFYGKKDEVKEALPKDRQIVGIYKQKPQLISAFPENLAHQQYIAQLEEDMSYYIYMFKFPDGTLCTYDEHFNPKQKEKLSRVGNFLEFNLYGVLTETQRIATEYSLELWSEQLAGTQPVNIEVNLFSLGEGVLGMSYFPPCFFDPDTNIWYPYSLWKQKMDTAISSEWDIFIVMNSDYRFYFGLDAAGGMDFVTIMIHEITHGLGFGCYCSPNGNFFYGAPGIYDCMLYKGLTGPCFTELTNDERAALLISNNLYSGRPNSNLLEAHNGVRVKMYAPTRYSGGSTAHHWDNGVGFVNFMGYSYTYPLHTFNNRKIGIMKDMGYELPKIDSNAVWITFYGNGGKGTRNPQPFLPGEEQNLKINSFTKSGYSFLNWNTSIDGTGESYSNRAPITITENLVLYAQWVPGEFTLTFYPNLGTVSPKSKQVIYHSPIGELPIPVRKGHKFEGWRIGYSNVITEETIWEYESNNTAVAKWSVLSAIEDNPDQTSVQIYPNPTPGQLRITNYELLIDNVEIFDVYGRKVYDDCNSYALTVLRSYDLTIFPAGIYFLKITTEQGTVFKKVIKI